MVSVFCRRTLLCSLIAAPVILFGSGCKSSSGWRAPWSGWGWSGASTSNATALNISKPSTQAPSPSNTPGQPQRGLAARGATAPGNSVAAYPTTSQADAYPAQPAATWQPGNATDGQVAPVGGLQVGPYSMQSNPPASGYADNTQPYSPVGRAPGPGGVTAEVGDIPRDDAPGTNGTEENGYSSREDYRTADQGTTPRYGDAAGSAAPQESPEPSPAGTAFSGAEGPAIAAEPSVYGPAEETSPAEGAFPAPTGSYSKEEAPAEPASPRSFGPPNTVAPAASRPAARPPASGEAVRPPLPQSLSGAGGYRPGSTSGITGARNAGNEQPQNAAAPAAGTSWR
jgi:hypothetical protein